MTAGDVVRAALVALPFGLLLVFLAWALKAERGSVPPPSVARRRPWLVRQLVRKDTAAEVTTAAVMLLVAAVWEVLGEAPFVLWVLAGAMLVRALVGFAPVPLRPSSRTQRATNPGSGDGR